MREIEGSGSTSLRSLHPTPQGQSFVADVTEQTDNPLSERLVAGYASL